MDISAKEGSAEYNVSALGMMRDMDHSFQPLDLTWNGIKWGEIHYAGSPCGETAALDALS